MNTGKATGAVLISTGYRVAGRRPTWPTDTSMAPLATIDHVLVKHTCLVRLFETVPLPGGDHRAVVAETVLPG